MEQAPHTKIISVTKYKYETQESWSEKSFENIEMKCRRHKYVYSYHTTGVVCAKPEFVRAQHEFTDGFEQSYIHQCSKIKTTRKRSKTSNPFRHKEPRQNKIRKGRRQHPRRTPTARSSPAPITARKRTRLPLHRPCTVPAHAVPRVPPPQCRLPHNARTNRLSAFSYMKRRLLYASWLWFDLWHAGIGTHAHGEQYTLISVSYHHMS